MKLWSINGAAEELRRDKRFLAKLLSSIPGDGQLGKHRAWYLATILSAIERRERGGGPDELLIREAERLAERVELFLDRLERERDLQQRRAVARRDGAVLSQLDEVLIRLTPPEDRPVLQPFVDQVSRYTFKRTLELCQWQLDQE